MEKKEELVYIEDEMGGYICTREYVCNNYAYLLGEICCYGTKEDIEEYLGISITEDKIKR